MGLSQEDNQSFFLTSFNPIRNIISFGILLKIFKLFNCCFWIKYSKENYLIWYREFHNYGENNGSGFLLNDDNDIIFVGSNYYRAKSVPYKLSLVKLSISEEVVPALSGIFEISSGVSSIIDNNFNHKIDISPNPTTDQSSEADQRNVGRGLVCAFFRKYLQGAEGYKEIFTGRIELSSLPDNELVMTYQDKSRMNVDHFENIPTNASLNSLGGTIVAAGFSNNSEIHMNQSLSDYISPPTTDNRFFHSTLGLRLSWASNATYESNLAIPRKQCRYFVKVLILLGF